MLPARAACRSGVSVLLAKLSRIVRIDAGLEQLLDDRGVALFGGKRERRHAVVVLGVHVRTGADERRGCLGVVQISRPVQRRRTVAKGRVDVDLLLEQGLDSLFVAALGRIGYRRILDDGLGCEHAHRQQHRERQTEEGANTHIWASFVPKYYYADSHIPSGFLVALCRIFALSFSGILP
jgi:hypothetical protein